MKHQAPHSQSPLDSQLGLPGFDLLEPSWLPVWPDLPSYGGSMLALDRRLQSAYLRFAGSLSEFGCALARALALAHAFSEQARSEASEESSDHD